jgi:hypothetical protein
MVAMANRRKSKNSIAGTRTKVKRPNLRISVKVPDLVLGVSLYQCFASVIDRQGVSEKDAVTMLSMMFISGRRARGQETWQA